MTISNGAKQFISVKAVEYRFLKSISIVENEGQNIGRFDINLLLASSLERESSKFLKLVCKDAFDIQLGRIESRMGFHLEIRDVSESQIEGAKFRVIEAEEDAFSFYCKAFSAEVLE